jgi:hypothetical protein
MQQWSAWWGLSIGTNHNVFFPSARTFAHLAFAAALSLALTAGLLRRSLLAGLAAFALAHLALPAARMAALPAAPIRLLPFLAALNLAERIFRALARAFMSLRL